MDGRKTTFITVVFKSLTAIGGGRGEEGLGGVVRKLNTSFPPASPRTLHACMLIVSSPNPTPSARENLSSQRVGSGDETSMLKTEGDWKSSAMLYMGNEYNLYSNSSSCDTAV